MFKKFKNYFFNKTLLTIHQFVSLNKAFISVLEEEPFTKKVLN